MKNLTQEQGDQLRKDAMAAKYKRALAKVKAKNLGALTNAEISLLEGQSWSGRTGYEAKLAHLERKRDISDKISLTAKEPDRKDACRENLELFCKTYLAHIFNRPFGRSHKRIIRKLQKSILSGGRFAIAMSRGFGKTSLSVAAAVWALAYGHRSYFVIVAAEQTLADGILGAIKEAMVDSDKLAEDFPEVVGPIRLAKGSGMKVRHYTWKGEPIRMEWRKKVIVMPSIPGSPAAGSLVESYGITGRLRGANRMLPDGSILRPNFALIDDFQTDESAHSKEQCRTRISLIRSAVLQMAGHERRMSAVVLCTVIVKDDAADQLVSDPTWERERVPFLLAMPHALETLWQEYFKLRKAGLGKDQMGKAATKFYRANRKAMDEGAMVSWEYAFDRKGGEISALQHAMNILCDTPDAFWSEYQQMPKDVDAEVFQIDQAAVIGKTTTLDRCKAPDTAKMLVCHADINRAGLHWVAAAFDQQMSAHVAAYGKWPESGDLWEENAPELVRRQAIYSGMQGLAQALATAPWNQGGKAIRPIVMGFDRGYEPEVVHRFCWMAPLPFRTVPTRGYAANKYYVRKATLVAAPQEQCHVTQSPNGNYLAFNADYWREIAQRSFLGIMGSPGTTTLYKADPRQHTWLADHICAEKLRNKYRTDQGLRWEWVLRPGQKNDLLDAFVGCFVLAAWSGLSTSGKVHQNRPSNRPARPRGGVTVIPL